MTAQQGLDSRVNHVEMISRAPSAGWTSTTPSRAEILGFLYDLRAYVEVDSEGMRFFAGSVRAAPKPAQKMVP